MKSPREYQVKSGWILCKRSKTTPNADAIFRPLLLFSPRRHSPKVVSPSLSPSLDLMHATRKGDEQRRRGDRHAKASEREGSERAARFGRVEEERTKTRDAGCWMQAESPTGLMFSSFQPCYTGHAVQQATQCSSSSRHCVACCLAWPV